MREATLQRSLGAVLAAVLLLVAFAVGVAWRNAQGRFGSADFVAEVRRALAATRLRADPAGGAG